MGYTYSENKDVIEKLFFKTIRDQSVELYYYRLLLKANPQEA